jgi:hypothetical protein
MGQDSPDDISPGRDRGDRFQQVREDLKGVLLFVVRQLDYAAIFQRLKNSM